MKIWNYLQKAITGLHFERESSNAEYFDNLKHMVMWKVDTFPFREKIEEMSRLRDELTTKGFNLPPEKEKGEHFDSNCITPVWNYYLS